MMRKRRLLLSALAVLAISACGQPDTDMSNGKFATPKDAALYQAAARGDLAQARQLLAEGASLNSRNAREMTPLDVAMVEGNRRAFESLLDLGTDPTWLGDARDTSMHLAAILHDSRWLAALLKRGFSTEVKNALGAYNGESLGRISSDAFKHLLEVYKTFYKKLLTRNSTLPRLNIFTTNYDLYSERAMDSLGIHYANGFTGGISKYFNPTIFNYALAEKMDLSQSKWNVIDNFFYLYKIHGSVNWVENNDEGKLLCRSEERRVGKECRSRWSPYH